MTARTFTVALVDLSQNAAQPLTGNEKAIIAGLLGRWLQSACATASVGGTQWTATVNWTAPSSSATIIVYFVRDQTLSALSSLAGTTTSGRDTWGWTVSSTLSGQSQMVTGSEIYVNLVPPPVSLRAQRCAAGAFHEIGHNQLRMSDQQLHGLGGSSPVIIVTTRDIWSRAARTWIALRQRPICRVWLAA